MVGYQKDDSISAHQKLIAGCISGVLTRFITQPMDIIKVRTQLQKKEALKNISKGWFSTARKIFREEGFTAFWAGHNLGQIHSIIAVSSQFYMFELSTTFAAKFELYPKYRPYIQFWCGVFAGCCSTTIVLPIEVVRVRQMIVKDQYKGMWNGARMVYNNGGIFAFYEGLSASLMQMGPAVGISFGVFSVIQPMILGYFHKCDDASCKHSASNAHRPENLLIASTVAGSMAGFLSKTLTYPFDLAKRRLQIGSHQEDQRFRTPSTSKHLVKCKTLTDCIVTTVKTEGFSGLYRGWKITMYKAQVTSIIAFTSYEMMCYVLRELENG